MHYLHKVHNMNTLWGDPVHLCVCMFHLQFFYCRSEPKVVGRI